MESVHGTTDTLKHKSCVSLTNKCLKTKHIISVGRIELPRSLRSVKVVGTEFTEFSPWNLNGVDWKLHCFQTEVFICSRLVSEPYLMLNNNVLHLQLYSHLPKWSYWLTLLVLWWLTLERDRKPSLGLLHNFLNG